MLRLALVGSILFTLRLSAQSYFPFPTDSARWKVSYGSGALGCPTLVAEYQYEIIGDTIISSVTYKKISRTGYTNNIFCYPDDWGYIGCIREDTNKRIYFRSPIVNYDTLLYDFNLAVGDTLSGFLCNYCSDSIYVSSIDSVLVGSSFRKRYNLSSPPQCGAGGISIIEGIGSTRGLIDLLPSFESGSWLDCFAQNGQTLYPDTTTFCPILIESVAEPEEVKWSGYPNPATDEITFQSEAYSGNLNITITNLTAQIVRFENISAMNSGFTISRNGLESGIYFIEISDEQGRTSRIKFAFL